MSKKIKDKMASYLMIEGAIRAENVEIYLYGIDLLVRKVCHIMFILLLGLVLDQLCGTVLFLIIYARIREYSGGYHANSSIGCFWCTIVVTICAIALLKVLPQIASFWNCGSLLFCGGIIWMLSPQEAENKPLLETEKVKYRQVTHKYLLISSGLCVLGLINPLFIYSVITAWIIQATMLVLGILKSTCACGKRI